MIFACFARRKRSISETMSSCMAWSNPDTTVCKSLALALSTSVDMESEADMARNGHVPAEKWLRGPTRCLLLGQNISKYTHAYMRATCSLDATAWCAWGKM